MGRRPWDGRGWHGRFYRPWLRTRYPLVNIQPIWLRALDTALARIADFAPGALVLALGLDAYEAEPLAGGAVTTSGFGQMAAMIAGLRLPAVIVREGG